MAVISCITNKGLNIIANRLKGIGTEPIYFGWGTGVGDADPSNTSLFTEASEPRIALTSVIDTVSVAGDAYKLTGAMTANAAKTITNWGVFDSSVSGNMLLQESMNPGILYGLGSVAVLLFRIQMSRVA